MRLLALDYGQKRTGIAVTDELQIIASGLTTVPTETLLAFLTDYFSKEKVSKVLIGKPLQMNNTPSESWVFIEKFAQEFQKKFPTHEIVWVDERFTSKMAQQSLLQSGHKKKTRQNKALLDEVSATIMLQDYLNRYKY